MTIRVCTYSLVLLICVLFFMPVGCTGNQNNPSNLLTSCIGKEIAILSPSAKVCETLYNCITTLQSNHANIIHDTYPDDFIKQESQYLSKATYLIYHSDAACLIVIPAIPGTTKLFSTLRKLKPELMLIAVFPMEDPIPLSKVATAVYYVDFNAQSTPNDFENSACSLIRNLCQYLLQNSEKRTHPFPINGIYKLVMTTD